MLNRDPLDWNLLFHPALDHQRRAETLEICHAPMASVRPCSLASISVVAATQKLTFQVASTSIFCIPLITEEAAYPLSDL